MLLEKHVVGTSPQENVYTYIKKTLKYWLVVIQVKVITPLYLVAMERYICLMRRQGMSYMYLNQGRLNKGGIRIPQIFQIIREISFE